MDMIQATAISSTPSKIQALVFQIIHLNSHYEFAPFGSKHSGVINKYLVRVHRAISEIYYFMNF